MASSIVVKEKFNMKIKEEYFSNILLGKYKDTNVKYKYLEFYEGKKGINLDDFEEIIPQNFKSFVNNWIDINAGWCKVKEGIFYFDFEKYRFYIVEWIDVTQDEKIEIMNFMSELFQTIIKQRKSNNRRW